MQENRTNKWYLTILGFTIIIPALYFTYLFLMSQNSNQTFEGFIQSQPIYVVLMLISFIIPIWGHILNKIPDEQRVRKGRGDQLLTYMLVSQIVVGNVVMAILIFLTKRKLPQVSNNQRLTASEKIIAIILLGLSIFSGFILLRLTMNM